MPSVVRFRRTPTAEETSDEALVALALHDRHAFGLLYDRYVGPVYRYCYGRLGNREQAEDATSLVFARALAALPTQRGPSVRSWLFAIAHNVVLNMRRDAASDRPLDDAFGLQDPGPSPDELAAEAERRSSVAWALTQLPDDQRRVVELRVGRADRPGGRRDYRPESRFGANDTTPRPGAAANTPGDYLPRGGGTRCLLNPTRGQPISTRSGIARSTGSGTTPPRAGRSLPGAWTRRTRRRSGACTTSTTGRTRRSRLSGSYGRN